MKIINRYNLQKHNYLQIAILYIYKQKIYKINKTFNNQQKINKIQRQIVKFQKISIKLKKNQ